MSDRGSRVANLAPEQLSRLLQLRAAQSRQGRARISRTGLSEAPLSFSQQPLWFLWRLDPAGSFYNIPAAVRLSGRLDVPRLEKALNRIAARHSALRTVFPEDRGEAIQRVLPEMAVPLEVREADARRAMEIVLDEARRPFELTRGPLLRALLLKTGADEHILVLTVHHIVADGWSMRVLAREISAWYGAGAAGARPALPLPDLQFTDFAAWQRAALAGERLQNGLHFWKETLRGAPGLLEMPADRPRPPVESHRGARFRFRIPGETGEGVRRLAREENATPFMVALAAFQAVLARYTGTSDIPVGTPVANRGAAQTENLIGLFVNAVVVRAPLDGRPSFRELVRRVRRASLEAYAHQEVPFELVAAELEPQRDLSRNPLFQVVFQMDETPLDAFELEGIRASLLEIDPGTSKFDLTLTVEEDVQGAQACFEYNTDLFDRWRIERMAGHFRTLLDAALAAPDRRVEELPLLTRAESRLILKDWNATAAARGSRSFHEAFEQQAARTPDALAVCYEGDSCTYGELNRRANRLARYLRGLGVGPEVCVGLSIERSVNLIVALLGILKAGGAYVPLDPAYPRERLDWMMERSGAPVLVRASGGYQPEAGRARVVDLDSLSVPLAAESGENFSSGAEPSNLAYVIFTSGSTGEPKGAMIEHRQLMNFAAAHGGEIYDKCGRAPLRVAMNAQLSFDASLQEVVALPGGHTLYIIPQETRLDSRELLAWLRRNRIDVLDIVPSQLKLLLSDGLLEEGGYAPPVLVPGGEAVDEKTWAALAAAPSTETCNCYGPTECTVESTMCRVAARREAPSIGRPISNARVYVLDRTMEPLPAGVPGELYIGGAGVGRGYLGRPDLTAERFVPDAFGEEPGALLYRTGDLVRWTGDGFLEFLGRTDRQVKVRGFRIELGEIEAVLRKAPGVRDAAVVARSSDGGATDLVAYVVSAASDVPRLREALGAALPPYMTPAAFVPLEEFPLLPNGKVDFKALPAPRPADRANAARAGEPPRDELEKTLAGMWSAMLGGGPVGVHDNFFELGGDSIRAAVLTNRMQQEFGVELPVKWLFQAPTIGEYAARFRAERSAEAAGLSPLSIQPSGADLPLSLAQQRLWMSEQIEGGALYNIAAGVRLRGVLDAGALERSLAAVIARHAALRTAFVAGDGHGAQRVLPSVDLNLETTDLCSLPALNREVEAARIIAEDARTPFVLDRPPLLRARLLRFGADDHLLAIVVHHLVFDGWSSQVLVREIGALYGAFLSGRPSPLPPLRFQYADWAVWQRRRLEKSDALAAGIAFWKAQLQGTPALLALPADHPRPASRSQRGAMRLFSIPPDVAESLSALSRRHGATLFMTLAAAFSVLLHRYSGQSDILLGTPVAGRTRRESEEMIGFFVNTVVLRANLGGDPEFTEALARMREAAGAALAHQDVPFEMVVEALAPERSADRSPLFQVMFAMQSGGVPADTLAGLEITPVALDTGTSKFDLMLAVTESAGALQAAFEYSRDLFEAETIARMEAHFLTLLRAIIENPDRRISDLDLLSAAERRSVTREWNATACEFPARSFPQAFEAQAARTPDAIAVRYRSERLAYGELNRRANLVADYLRTAGVGPEVRVGISMERSIAMLVGILGVLKAGGAYVPLDPVYPPERIAFVVRDSGAALVLTEEKVATALSEAGCELNPFAGTAPENLAYIIYTSGSTGVPKGVMVTHGGLMNYLEWCRRSYPLDRMHGAPVASSVSFDLTVTALLAPLAAGSTVDILPEDLGVETLGAALAERGGYGLIKITPAHLQLLGRQLTAEQARRAAAAFVIGGENLLAEHIAFWQRHAPDAALINEYGPTETVVGCCVYRAAPGESFEGPMPIGKPIVNTRMYVLDRYLEPVPPGVTGELYIGGAGVARGYLHRPDLTAERFVPDPFAERPGERMYRSGDLGRQRRDGVLECLGRVDEQVKIRGFRVELGEIEAALQLHPAVRQCVVLARSDPPGDKRLIAWFAPGDASPSELRAHLRQRLPEYMVPSAFVAMDELPLTHNGKVDRRALPAPDAAAQTNAPYAAPRTEAESTLAAIWAEVLRVKQVGIDDNFFEQGGDSILALQAAARANEAGLRVTARQLFRNPTIAGLAALARTGRTSAAEQGAVEGPLPLTPVQRWFFELDLPEAHHFNQSVLLEIPHGFDRDLAERALNRLIEHHDALRLRFTHDGAGWKQYNAPPGETVALSWEDLSRLEPERRTAALEQRCAELQSGLDLAAGPLLRAAYFDFGAGRCGRLLLVIHHLAVDTVSWGVLLHDLEQAYAGRQLAPKTSSFRQWARALERYAARPDDELEYWRAVLSGADGRLRRDLDGANTQASAEAIPAAVELKDAPPESALRDLLLTALWRTLGPLVIDVESHGRGEIEDGLDLSRTVGWFTSIYPVRLAEVPARTVPNYGLGYGVLRYGAAREEFRSRPDRDVLFNYLGKLTAPWRQAAESPGPERAPGGRRSHALEISAWLADGRLEMRWIYSRALHRRESVEALVRTFAAAVNELAADRTGELSAQELEAFMTEVGAGGTA